MLINFQNWVSLISVLIQGTVLALILTKNRYAKISIKIWSFTFVLSGGFKLIALFCYFMDFKTSNNIESLEKISVIDIIINSIMLLSGFLFFVLCDKYIRLVKDVTKEADFVVKTEVYKTE